MFLEALEGENHNDGVISQTGSVVSAPPPVTVVSYEMTSEFKLRNVFLFDMLTFLIQLHYTTLVKT